MTQFPKPVSEAMIGSSSFSTQVRPKTESADARVKDVFTCNSCYAQFSNLQNLLAHHWCVSDQELELRAQKSNEEYEQKLLNQRKSEAVTALAREVTYRIPSPYLNYSPPLHILSLHDYQPRPGVQ